MLTRTTLFATLIAGMAAAAPAYADGDAAAGQALFQHKCSICHAPVEGQNKIGPSLWGVVGRKAGTLPTYTYSDAMKGANRTWDASTLNVYLTNPRQTIPGIKMIFAGLPDQTDRANVIAYLSTLK
jgi:cytochrome c